MSTCPHDPQEATQYAAVCTICHARTLSIRCPHCGLEFETRAGLTRHVKYCQRGPHARSPQSELLDCIYCNSKGWKDFRGLSLHVANDHLYVNGITPSKEVERAVYSHIKEQYMLPTPEVQTGNSNPFFNVKHFNGSEKGTVKLLGGREPTGQAAEYNHVLVDVKYNNKSYTWGLKNDQRNYAFLFKKFGADEKKWKGSVQVVIAKGKYINIVGS